MTGKKKKILLLVDWFTRGYKAGGPIQSSVNVAFALKEYYDIWVCTTDTDHGETVPYENIPSNQWINFQEEDIKVYYAKKATLDKKQIKEIIAQSGADYIYLNHLFSPLFVVYPLWLRYTGKVKTQVVLCPRGALYDSALAIKPLKKKIFINLFRLLGIPKRILLRAPCEEHIFPVSHSTANIPVSVTLTASIAPGPTPSRGAAPRRRSGAACRSSLTW